MLRSRHALEKAAHIHDEVADNWKVAQRIEAQRTVPIPHIGYTRDAGELFDAINPQSARTAGGMVTGAAEGECCDRALAHTVSMASSTCAVSAYLHGECIVMRLLTWLVAEDLKRDIEQLHCFIVDLTDRTNDTRQAAPRVCDTPLQCQACCRRYR